MRLAYQLCDVFTDRPLSGNPLAVFADAPELPDALMQAIAGELNLSETVFVRPAQDRRHSAALRIFTPATELPFAGHPTVGTAIALAALEKLPGARRSGDVIEAVLEEAVGPIPVTILLRDGHPRFAQFATAKLPEFAPAPPIETLAQCLSLNPADLGAQLGSRVHTPQIASCGVRFVCVPVRDAEVLARARLDAARCAQLLPPGAVRQFYLYTPDDGDGRRFRARMYAADFGIAEDPATGSAAAALAGVLAAREPQAEGTLRWSVAQGIEMGRPSLIEIEAEKRSGAISTVRVGGGAALVGSGVLDLPEL